MKAVTPTDCLRYINRRLGAAMQVIELSEDEIMRIVFQESLPTFSKFFPWKYKTNVHCWKDKVPGTRNKFFLKDIDKLQILGTSRIWLDNVAYYGSSQVTLNLDPFSYQLMSDAISATTTPITVLYEQPNIVEIHPYIESLGEALIELNCVHPSHLTTIGLDMRDHFLNLAYLDILVSLLPLRKRFENISTPYGQISLFLQEIDTAVQDRRELVENFQEMALRDSDAKRIWIA